jgi:hypothetical protein
VILDRGYGKPTQAIAQTTATLDVSRLSDEELEAIISAGRAKWD